MHLLHNFSKVLPRYNAYPKLSWEDRIRAGSCDFKVWYRADCRIVLSQWETALLCNAVSHWLGANLESSLWYMFCLHHKIILYEKTLCCTMLKQVSCMLTSSIWVRSRNCDCLVTWFCYQLITKPGNKTAAVPWPDPYQVRSSRLGAVYVPQNIYTSINFSDSKVHGANMGLTWVLSSPDGPHVGPMNLAIWVGHCYFR